MKSSVYMGSLGKTVLPPLKCSQNPYRVENNNGTVYALKPLFSVCFLQFIICLFLKVEGGEGGKVNVYMDWLVSVQGVQA